MHSDTVERHRDIGAVIDQKLRSGRSRESLHLLRKTEQLARREIAFAKLNGADTGCECARQHIEQWAPAGLLTICHKQEPTRKGRH